MASPPSGKDNQNLLFKTHKPHFFKVVLDNALRDRKLEIPKEFVRKYGNDLPSSVVLNVPTGAKWKVELFKCDGEIWFRNGWQEFAEYYSLAHSYFIVFEYDQHSNCHFNVLILDKSATEIDYPVNYNGDDEEINNLEKAENGSPHKKTKIEKPTTKFEPKRGDAEKPRKRKKFKKAVLKAQKLAHDEKEVLLQKARMVFYSKNPFFMVAMQSSYVHKGERLHISSSFAKRHLNEKHGDGTLKVMDGRTWSIRYHVETSRGRPRVLVYSGWNKFSRENHLEVGDVCVFELTNPAATTMNVTILRYSKNANSNPSLGNKKLKHEEETSNCQQFNRWASFQNDSSRYPFFKVVIQPCNLRSPLNIPMKFVIEHTKQTTEDVILQIENRRWPVKLLSYPSQSKLSAGWISFAKENSIRVGNVCIFELINSESTLFKVSIVRK
ncbi:hypothetical protein JCGZ_01468 [Jatropha curcas]|uniref:TF-B3 domain-containing protein n=1 Tax=Jatropha curcas TaxID=180498 RepID=A0A067LCJ3_JATCU|nr:B3 domain-containing transcription factor VRN1 [Jatropha curcas]KDP44968.1 hypothetical protein JCGZ_01468 [Jatropha curcas]